MQSKGLSRVFSNTTVQKHQFFSAQLSLQSNSHPYMTTGKTIALTGWSFVGKVMSLLCNMLSRLVTITPGGGLVTELCSTLAISWTVSLPDSSVHGILQTRILKWVAISFSRGSFQPRNQTQISCIGATKRPAIGTRNKLIPISFA